MRHYLTVLLAASVVSLHQSAFAQDLCTVEELSPIQPSVPFTGIVKIPVFVHVVTAADGVTGDVPLTTIEQQVAVLNAEFAGTDLTVAVVGCLNSNACTGTC